MPHSQPRPRLIVLTPAGTTPTSGAGSGAGASGDSNGGRGGMVIDQKYAPLLIIPSSQVVAPDRAVVDDSVTVIDKKFSVSGVLECEGSNSIGMGTPGSEKKQEGGGKGNLLVTYEFVDMYKQGSRWASNFERCKQAMIKHESGDVGATATAITGGEATMMMVGGGTGREGIAVVEPTQGLVKQV